MQELYSQTSVATGRSVEVSKVLRNTYTLLAMTLIFSAITAGISVAINVGYGAALAMDLVALGLLWFVLPRTANSAAGIGVVFAFTGLLGAGLGPMLNYYLATANGGMLVTQALAGTAIVFFALSGYVLTTGKDFSFMGGFLMIGLIVVLVTMVGALVLSFFGVHITGLQLALSAVIVLLMSGFILFDTSRIIHGGQTNYIMATTALYLDIYNLFIHLLHLLSAFSGDD